MADTPLPRPKMDWNSSDRTQAIRDFKQLCTMWFTIKRTEAELQHNYIMLWLGTEGLRLFNTWGLSAEQLKNPKNIWDKLALLECTQNFRISRLELQRLTQQQGESVEDFYVRCKEKAMKCQFADTTEERILEQIIAGTNIPRVQRELLAKDDSLTLQQALEIAKSHEASEKHMKQFQELASASNVDIVKTKTHKQCGNCGGSHPPRQCPAYGTTCSNCHKRNHWKKMCRSTGRHPQDSGKQQQPPSNSTHHHHRRKNGKSPSRHFGRQRVHEISDGYQDSDELEHLDFASIEDSSDNRDELFAKLQIQYKRSATLEVKVDTGAQGNVLPLRIFRRMYPEKLNAQGFPKTGSTEQRNTTLHAYNGTRIEQYGVIELGCKYNDSDWHKAEFYVTDSEGPAILGLPSSRHLRLVTIHCAIQTTSRSKQRHIRNADDLRRLYPDRFEGIGNFEGELHITLQDGSQPVVQPPRKYPIQLLDEIKTELKKMEDMDVITPVTEPTDWVNALAFSRKSSGGLRVCLDPRALNNSIKRIHHKTPTLEEITNRLSGSTIFSKLDAKHGYWSIKLDHESSLLTTFNSPCGRYRFKRLPFGLNVSQDAFQRSMDSILCQCPGTIGITDDIIVHGKDEEEHNKNLHNLMKIAQKCGLVFNAEKCHIKTPQIKFFGMIYHANGVQPDPEKCNEIQAMPAPQNVTELQQFLGIIQYLSPFIAKLSDQTAPLRALTRKDAKFEWNKSHQKAFDIVKSTICKDMSLQYFDVNKPSVIQVDASKIGLGAALLQNGKPIAFASKALTDTEQRYANIERELLAVVFGCERFHTYVYGKQFIVESDHKPLEQIQKKSLANTPPRLQRMMLRLQQYDVKIQYRPGREMILADSLSRLNPRPEKAISLEQSVHGVQFSSDRLEELQQKTDTDSELSALKDFIIDGWPDSAKLLPKNLRDYWSCRDELSVQDGLVMKGERIIIPKSMQQYILQNIHAGHQGTEKCKLRAKTCVYWRGINADIDRTVRSCIVCQAHQNSQQAETLLPHEIPDGPWQVIATDIFHFDGRDYLLVADYYSKMPFVRYLNGQATSAQVIALLKHLFSEHGVPNRVMSDNGPQYDAAEFKKFASEWGFQHVTSSPRYPQSNGFIERMVQTVKKTFLKAQESDMDRDMAMLCLRTTPIDHTLPSPAELLYSRIPKSNLPTPLMPLHDNADVRNRLRERQLSQKKHHDKAARDLPPLQRGQLVQMQDNAGSWSPATVIEQRPEPRSYTIRTPNGGVYRRNRRQLRAMKMQPRPHITWADQPASPRHPEGQQPEERQPDISTPSQLTSPPPASQHLRRSQRVIKPVDRLIEQM